MSDRESRIRRALERRGYRVVMVEWSPIGPNVEMAGREGGWTVLFDPPAGDWNGYIGGYNVRTVLEDIAQLPDPV